MKKVIIISVVLFSIFLFLSFWSVTDSIEENSIDESKSTKSTKQLPNKKTSTLITDKTKTIGSQTSNQSSEDLPRNQFFHQDPLVDMIMGINHFSLCIIQNNDKTSQLSSLNAKQKQFLQPYQDRCETEIKQVKNYQVDNMVTRMSDSMSKYGKDHIYLQMMNSRSQLSDMLADQALETIRNMNGNELIMATSLLKPYFKQHILPMIHDTLGGNNEQVSLMAMNQAMTLIACQSSADCSATSGLMLARCVDHETACGLNYFEYIESHYMPGFRNEVILAANLLQSHFGFEL
ncbi:hypothetical protein [Marinicella rhabdoformis]|uniref:hypothetical protein n=1 Tax=Marinicella rhabdoformis TaxID=2580566 RepID=UPI0012AEDABC|nr:hypothetical protein [Marinicella rhabdoformis]